MSRYTNTHEALKQGITAIRRLSLEPVLTRYETHLAETREIDFADMIFRATDYVRQGAYRSPFTRILNDEFQDITDARVDLIRALLAQRSVATLFCVGDDRRSIYRFTGSDVTFA